MARLAGMYVLDEQAFDDVYGPQERAAIAEVVDMLCDVMVTIEDAVVEAAEMTGHSRDEVAEAWDTATG